MQQNTQSLVLKACLPIGESIENGQKATLNSGVLGAKRGILVLKKTRIGYHLERLNGAKCSWCS